MPPLRLNVDGNIGSLKSALLHRLHSHFHIHTNPVQLYTNLYDINILTPVWENKLDGILNFQYTQLLELVFQHRNCNSQKNPIVISEQSIDSLCHIYWPFLHENNNLSLESITTLQHWAEIFLDARMIPENEITIYVRSDPSECHWRLAHQGCRKHEDLTLEQLTQLHKNLERYYIENRMNKRVWTLQFASDSQDEIEKEIEKLKVRLEDELYLMQYTEM